jgi:uncharacterized protein YodC (DUF2158 family)
MSSEDGFFKPGDIVRVISGGPKMTILEVEHNTHDEWTDAAKCMYYNGSQFVSQNFVRAILVKAGLDFPEPSNVPLTIR